jgi:tRNA threonylcarbamoyladenosine biosynthesis protein TsaB
MILLVADTSGKNGCVAFVEANAPDSMRVIEEVPLAGGTFSAQLVPQIAELVSKHRFNKKDVDAFIVVSGPGSFTGLRVGLAAIKALAEVLHKPIVPVSLLEIVAVASQAQGTVRAALDAGRGEAYVGEYEMADGAARVISEQLLHKDEFTVIAAGSVVTPDKNLAAELRARGISVSEIVPVDAAMIARVGYRRLQSGEDVSPEQLEANYIRRSDAEIFAKTSS